MNMLIDNRTHASSPTHSPSPSHQHSDLCISTTPPTSGQQRYSPVMTHKNNNNNNNNNTNNNNESQISPITGNLTNGGKTTTLKRSFDVAFLMMPDERIKQKQQAEKQARLNETLERHQQLQQQQQHHQQAQYPTDLSPRAQLSTVAMPLPPQSHTPPEHFNLLETRRYTQLALRSPRVYDDPTVVIPIIDVGDSPLKSAFTKVTSSASASISVSSSSTSSSRLESPVDSAIPPLSPGQLSCHSMSPPVSTPPPRTNSGGNGSIPNGISTAPAIAQNPIIYHNFRPEYQFNGAFQSVNQMQALQAQRLKQHLLYRPPNNMANLNASGQGPPNGPPPPPPSEFLHAYPGFPFPPGAGGPSFAVAATAQPELPRIVQNPAAAAILSTLIPPTLASTFSLTAQNVCAKCNISFRMTSDLVYHMRSHHKSEVAFDPNRRKREEKLRCPVCQETFRERHHLTRHMTAHQDKESDHPPSSSPSSSSSSSSSATIAATLGDDNEIINVVSGGNVGGHHGRHSHHRISNMSK